MPDTQREELALRVITTSGRAALRKTTDPHEREQLRNRVLELLADLERQVMRDSASEEMLKAIKRERDRLDG